MLAAANTEENKLTSAKVSELLSIMQRLRDPASGCPWDLEQNFASIAPYTIEEAYEVSDAIERQNYADLKDELGDLLLQVVFHSQMAEENNLFTFNDVVECICDKMIRRHPHVFAGGTPTAFSDVVSNWEELKSAERSERTSPQGALSGVALALPALTRAQKIQKRAARVGFDWPDPNGAMAKLAEEVDELREAVTPEQRREELGDLLFAAVNVARHLDIDAEAALKSGTAKFERRFAQMEHISGDGFAQLQPAQQEQLWQIVKANE
jgi:ATP diphosphatase